jgi:mannosyltransferase OCH1-like enzyme
LKSRVRSFSLADKLDVIIDSFIIRYTMIPKIIHQTYKVTSPLPEVYATCQSTILELHPDFEYKFWTDEDMFDEIKTNFPLYYEAFMALPRMIMRIDMFRYFLMYQYGGLYVDLDYMMFKPFDMLESDAKIVLPSNREECKNPTKYTCIGNSIFASEPNHPFWKMVIDTLFTNKREKYRTNQDVVNGTGPVFLYEMTKLWLEENPQRSSEIYVPPRYMFHPPTNTKPSMIKKLQHEKTNYGMHFCTGMWANNKL